MDLQILVDKLGLVAGGGLSIVDIQMVQWGRSLIFGCVYRTVSQGAPPDDPVRFSLVFNDCREVRYKVYAHIGEHESGEVTSVADVAEMALGKGNHRRDANILTNHFAVTLTYGEVFAEMHDQRYPLEPR
jgi:hypothetical protein